MAETIQQQRQALEEARRRLTSQQSLRQVQDRNVTLQRQKELQRLSQAEKQISEQVAILEQAQKQQASQSNARQEALRVLIEKGKGSSELYSLSPQERAEVEAVAAEIKASRERSAGIVAVSKAEQALSASLSPELRQQIFREAASGSPTITLPDLSSKFYQLSAPQYTPVSFITQPLVVAPAKTFTQQFKDIVNQPVERTRSGAYNLPAQVRKISPLTSLTFSTVVAKTEQKLKEFGIGRDSPLFKQTSIPVSRIVGDVALGSLLVGLSGTTGQVAVSYYVKNGRRYYFDNTGQVVGSESVEQASKNIADFRQALRESSVFKKADSFYPNEANLRMKTRDLIQKAQANPKLLNQLKELYKKEGRADLYKDIYEQEIGEIARTNAISRSIPRAVKDQPAQLTGAGQLTATSQYAGTGQYERTDMVAGAIPQQRSNQITNPMLLSNTNVAFGQSSFDRNKLAQISLLGLKLQTKQATQQINQLGLRSETQTKQGSGQARALLSMFKTAQATRQQSRQLTQQRNQLEFSRPRGRRTPRKKPPRIRIPFGLPEDSISISKARTEDSLGVGIEVRRGGRFTLIGQESTLGKALIKASGLVDVNLARSFRLRQLSTGRLLDISELPIGFRRSKSEAKTFVELPSRSLSQYGEKKEIQYFKKAKSKRRLPFI